LKRTGSLETDLIIEWLYVYDKDGITYQGGRKHFTVSGVSETEC
jgi:hypothetical protein